MSQKNKNSGQELLVYTLEKSFVINTLGKGNNRKKGNLLVIRQSFIYSMTIIRPGYIARRKKNL